MQNPLHFGQSNQDYATGQVALGDERVQLIKDYARSYDTLNDANARDVVQRMINIEGETLNLREDYWPKFMKALGAKRAAKFYQVEKREIVFAIYVASKLDVRWGLVNAARCNLGRFHQQEAQHRTPLLSDIAQSSPISAAVLHGH